MKNNHFSRKTRQLKFLVAKVNANVSGNIQLSEDGLKRILGKINILIKQLANHLGLIRLKHMLGASAMFFGLSASAQSFKSPVENPFGLQSTYYFAMPTAVDLDDDGDLDIMVAEYYGEFQYFENTGSKRHAKFAAPVQNPHGVSPPESTFAKTTFADIDGDGDLDMMSGGYYGVFNFFENTGTSTDPSFAAHVENPFGLDSVYYLASPTFADLDDDGDFDLLVGGYYNVMTYFENTGTKTNPQFAKGIDNPFNLQGPDSLYFACPDLADIDGDGDLDIISSGYYGAMHFFENSGTKSNPNFEPPVENPFGLKNAYYLAFPSFIDIDDDGDFDILAGEIYGNFQFYRNSEKVANVTKEELDNSLSIYPNPAADILHLELSVSPKSIEIIDIHGRTILTPDNMSSKINISSLQTGSYYLKIRSTDGIESSKVFVKE